MEGYAARLALVVHTVRAAADSPAADPGVLDEESLTAGVALSRWFGHEARRVYGLFEETNADRQRRNLVELVQRYKGSITARELMRSSRDYTTAESAEEVLEDLVKAGIGRWENVGPTERGGRPTRRFVLSDIVGVNTIPIETDEHQASPGEPVKVRNGDPDEV